MMLDAHTGEHVQVSRWSEVSSGVSQRGGSTMNIRRTIRYSRSGRPPLRGCLRNIRQHVQHPPDQGHGRRCNCIPRHRVGR